MSVLIKGMKMPKYCIECKFCGSGSINEFEFWCGLTGSRLGAIGDIVLWEDMSAADCPLVEVPTPHGRLIDADALEDKLNGLFRTRDYDTIDFYNHAIADCIATVKNVPTIIEAEEEP